jgi:two-component system, NarL family, nitrate/nitrite response regulator NarL
MATPSINHDLPPRGIAPGGATPIRLLLVDHHVIVRTGLRLLLEHETGLTVVGEASQRAEALAAAADTAPDIVLLDLDLGGASGLDLISDLQAAAPQTRVLVLTGVRDLERLGRAVRLGARGVVRKEEEREVLVQAIAKVHAGEVWLDPAPPRPVLRAITQLHTGQAVDPEAAKIATLSLREREIITLVAQGLKNRPIAQHLCLAEATVRHHLTAIIAKLGLTDRLGLVVYAYRHGLACLPR